MMHLAVFTSHTEGTTSFLCSEYFPFPQTFPLGLGDGQFYAWTDGLRRKDWHDYGSMQKEAMRSGMEFSEDHNSKHWQMEHSLCSEHQPLPNYIIPPALAKSLHSVMKVSSLLVFSLSH
ncbi:hypothetical protein FD754_001078 [Muntiacus muntjak]|uniref:Uncharacterized protein n=1 Tax=Muntiacus muntjak TaxID=9888 RepID=A0A5N3W5P1_MUNMU|nr:hypothetical protein FD754_001078 [Muntiacus muntjak]